jgi:acetolactate synthase-1/2/3 large subunit
MTLSGATCIARILAAHGVGSVFAVAGAAHTHLLAALADQGTHILSHRHEAGAVGAADGYARVSGKPGIGLIVADQGLPNAIGALATAWHALSPVVLLVAAPGRSGREAEGALDQDQLALVTPLSKWARTCPDRARLPAYLQAAFKQARAGRPGPVVLLIPEEQLQQSGADAEAVRAAHAAPSRPQPDASAIAAAAGLLGEARRPLIVAGAGAAWGEAGPALRRLVGDAGLPLMANGLGRGQVPEDWHHVLSWPYGQVAAREADVVLVAGARLTQRLGLGLPPRFAADARFIQVDCAGEAFHRNRPVEIGIQADAGAALESLATALAGRRLAHEGVGWISRALAPRVARVTELKAAPGPMIHPVRLADAVARRLPAEAVFAADGADIATWSYGAIAVRRPRGFLDHYPMGAMGSVTALAIGAAAALREAAGAAAPPVVLLTGDGALGFHPAELHAAALAGLNLKVIVGNDGAWGTELHGQVAAIGRSINTQLGQLPYEKLGEAFGLRGLRADRLEALDPVLDLAFADRDPVLVNVLTDPAAGEELKRNEAVRMILFSDVLEGTALLAGQR